MPASGSETHMQSCGYVKDLLDAEKKASKILDDARKKKASKMKKAKDEAQLEIESTRKECEDNLKARVKSQSVNQDKSVVEFDKKLKTEVTFLTSAYQKNNIQALEFLLTVLNDIKPELHENLNNF
jgi:ATP synthase subunit G